MGDEQTTASLAGTIPFVSAERGERSTAGDDPLQRDRDNESGEPYGEPNHDRVEHALTLQRRTEVMTTNEELIAELRERAAHPGTGSNTAQCMREAAARLAAVSDTTPSEGERISNESLWDFANDLLDAWNIEDTNPPSLIEGFRDRFVSRFRLTPPAPVDREKHVEHISVTECWPMSCIEGDCEHRDEDGQPEDLSVCPATPMKVCVGCMIDRGLGADPARWGDAPLAPWPCEKPKPAPIDPREELAKAITKEFLPFLNRYALAGDIAAAGRRAAALAVSPVPARDEWERQERIAACPDHGTHCWSCPRYQEERYVTPWLPVTEEERDD